MSARVLWRFLFFLAALVSSARGADPLDSWRWLNPLPTGNNLSDVTFASGLFVAVGPSGSIMTSPNGDLWTSQVSGTTNGLVGIGQGNGVIIAVGERGTILISSNAIDWAGRDSGVSTRLNQVVHGGGQFVVVGHGGTVLTSPDGQSWTLRTSGSTGSLTDIAYGNGLYVVVVGDFDSRTILRSSDGVSWESQNISATVAGGGYSAEYVAYGASRFVLSGTRRFSTQFPSSTPGLIVTSTDGSNWTHSASLPTTRSRHVVRFLNDHFIAPGYSNNSVEVSAQVSTNGLVWTNYLTGVSMAVVGDITYGAGRYLIAGGAVPVAYSSNLLSWVPNRPSPSSKNVSIAVGNGRRVAVGEMAPRGYPNDTFLNNATASMMAQSIGGEFTNVPVTSAALSRVYYVSNAFYAMGNNGTLLRSADGVNWSNRNSSTFERLWSMTYGAGKFIAVGEFGGSIWSLNGNLWSYLQTGTQYPLYSICHGSAGFVAVGLAGTIRTSPDGINWTPQDSGTARSLFGVTSGDSGYVAVGESGTVVTSMDGSNWILQPRPTTNSLYSIAFGNGSYVMAGINLIQPFSDPSEGVVLTSTNGQSWTPRNVGTTLPFYSVHFTGNTFLLAGANGAVLESGLVGGAQMQLAGQFVPAGFQVNLLGMPNQPCRVQAVDPVAGQWTDIGIVPAAGPMHFIDTNAALWPRRFYRAVSP